MNNYWAERMAKAQEISFNKSEAEISKQMTKYYQKLGTKVIEDFEITYDKLLNTIEAGKQATPADLYKLDKYWKMQGQIRQRLNTLGEKQISLLTKQFELNYFDVYYSLNIEGLRAFSTINTDTVKQMINQIWCADGKSWSQRIWENVGSLSETLNDGLIHCVTTGKKTSELKRILQSRFNVSYGRADALVRTELAHIQTQAAQQRYKDYGLDEMEVLVDPDERTCEICAELDGQKYSINAKPPIPAHPKCRCCMIPVVKIPPKN